MKSFATLFFLFACSAAAVAQAQYPLMWDKTSTTVVGAGNLLTLHKGIYTLEDRYLKAKWFREEGAFRRSAGVVYRLSKTALLDFTIDHYLFLIQHEIYGHGAGFREYGYRKNSYSLHPPPPYGKGNGWASSGRLQTAGRHITLDEHTRIYINGSEANTVMANALRLRWLQKGKMDCREALLYLHISNDLTAYILSTSTDSPSGSDILNFLRNMNGKHGYLRFDRYKLKISKLKKQVLINFANPYQFFALYTYFKTCLWSAERESTFPMINWKVKYLPAFRLGLTPFGSEYYFENFLVHSGRAMNLSVRYGDPTFHRFWGLGFRGYNLLTHKKLSVHASGDLWNQPSLSLGGIRTATETKKGFGGAASVTAFFPVTRRFSSLQLTGQIGYKTAGFLEGERLSGGMIGRFGLSFVSL